MLRGGMNKYLRNNIICFKNIYKIFFPKLKKNNFYIIFRINLESIIIYLYFNFKKYNKNKNENNYRVNRISIDYF